jgi:hypothetical protein
MAPPPIDNRGKKFRQRARRHFTVAQEQVLMNKSVEGIVSKYNGQLCAAKSKN